MASITLRDHNAIKQWAQKHGAVPAVVSRTGGMLRFEFSTSSAPQAVEVDWVEFFRIFDDKGLELVADEKPGSRFHKFVHPEAEAGPAGHQAAAGSPAPHKREQAQAKPAPRQQKPPGKAA